MSADPNVPLAMFKTSYTKVFIEVFAEFNIDIQKLLEESGLPADLLQSKSDHVPTEPVKRLLFLISTQVGENKFAELMRLAIRQRFLPDVLGSFAACETIEEALKLCNQVFTQNSPGSYITFEREHGRSWLCRAAKFEESNHFMWSEFFSVLYMIEMISTLSNQDWAPKQVKLRWPDTDIFRSAFPSKTQFFISQEKTAFYIEDEILQRPIHITADDTKFKEPLVDWHSSFTDSVFTALLPYSLEQDLTLEDSAEILNMSTRTLQRKLKEDKTSFRQIKESITLSVSCDLMEQGHSLTHIANQLGYNNISHFSRAFKRITGLTPKIYRKSIMGLQ
ncbi:AraC family transcriptional regulator [Vibrio maerlii]|uniref:AraC family transcriptional regulator n=1 Tax=Vibrio maerlii TaxID=2231648 RepID=UPI000E3EA26A|nr:AraC family transcriptional regulator [Vibrio maerlii]